jgi:hypothetical protein
MNQQGGIAGQTGSGYIQKNIKLVILGNEFKKVKEKCNE